MALFFPTRMHAIMMPYIMRCKKKSVASVKRNLLGIIDDMHHPGKIGDLGELRQQLLQFHDTEDQRNAFQDENVFGYVFYFIQEFLRLFDVDPLVARRRGTSVLVSKRLPHARRRNLRMYVVEVEFCKNATLEKCLQKNYCGWEFESPPYLIIELISHNVEPQLQMRWQGVTWELQSMIVFDCSHFVAYLKHQDGWYLHDDSRTLQHIPMQEYDFGDYYSRGMCQFEYGVKNTFFFFVPTE